MDSLRAPETSKFAVVTGSSRGIGKAISRKLLETGVNVVLVGRSIDKLKSVANDFSDLAGEAFCIQLDLANPSEIERFTGDLPESMDECHLLVHSAGIYRRESFTQSTATDLDDLYETNVRGCFILTRQLLPYLCAAKGNIVIINSSVVNSTSKEAATYAASKHALIGLANSLRAEVNPLGVRVLSVYPGRTATPMQETICNESGVPYRPELLLQPADIAEIVTACIDLPDTAEVTELHIRPKQKSI